MVLPEFRSLIHLENYLQSLGERGRGIWEIINSNIPLTHENLSGVVPGYNLYRPYEFAPDDVSEYVYVKPDLPALTDPSATVHVIFEGPTAAGATTMGRYLDRKNNDRWQLIINATDRPPEPNRPEEQGAVVFDREKGVSPLLSRITDHLDDQYANHPQGYLHLTTRAFMQLIDEGEFVEFSSLGANHYGTLRVSQELAASRRKPMIVSVVDLNGVDSFVQAYQQDPQAYGAIPLPAAVTPAMPFLRGDNSLMARFVAKRAFAQIPARSIDAIYDILEAGERSPQLDPTKPPHVEFKVHVENPPDPRGPVGPAEDVDRFVTSLRSAARQVFP